MVGRLVGRDRADPVRVASAGQMGSVSFGRWCRLTFRGCRAWLVCYLAGDLPSSVIARLDPRL
jgi:hypothetical protein